MSKTRDKLVELSRRLIAGTESGSVQWQESDRPHAYQYSTGKSTVIIGCQDNDGEPPYELEVRDQEGVVIEELKSAWFMGENGRVSAFWNPTLSDLYETARGSALNVDAVLNDLMSNLPPAPPDDDVPF